jgi:AcrR family transcriptional regulator
MSMSGVRMNRQIIKKGRKYDQVVEGARTVFHADGFEGASVDAIARAAGVSKATLYSYFPDKRLLFVEVAKQECRRQIDLIDAALPGDARPESVLREAGTRMIDFFTSGFGLSVFRLIVAEADRFPELGREFYRTGPEEGRRRMVAYLGSAVERGELRIGDVELAADQFVELCKADILPRLLTGVRREVSRDEKTRVIDGAVAMFMACYGVGDGGRRDVPGGAEASAG